jgi:hypothetical protein
MGLILTHLDRADARADALYETYGQLDDGILGWLLGVSEAGTCSTNTCVEKRKREIEKIYQEEAAMAIEKIESAENRALSEEEKATVRETFKTE